MKPHLLVVGTQATIPVRTGGDVRTVNLMLGLAAWFEVTAIIPQYPEVISDELKANPALAKVRFVSSHRHPANARQENHLAAWREWLGARDVGIAKHWRHMNYGWSFAANHTYYPIMVHECREWKPDIVLIEHAHLAQTLRFAARCWPGVLRCVNSHNVESHLIRQIFPDTHSPELRTHYLRAIERFERRLPRWADLLWVCSEADRQRYTELGVRGLDMQVVPNGVDTEYFSFQEAGSNGTDPTISFCGSLDYPPNEEGLQWFHQQVWPKIKAHLPDVRWSIVGSQPSPTILALAQEPRVELHPDVPDVRPFLRDATISISPLFRGSGTRLKILTAFSCGLPVVSTRLGMEGLRANPSEQLLVADQPDDFAYAVVRLLRDAALREKIRRKARDLAEWTYDWRAIAAEAARHLLTALEKRS